MSAPAAATTGAIPKGGQRVNPGHVESSTERGARLAHATVVLLRHALTCDQHHNWQMARVMWQKQADAYRQLQHHNAIANLRKNTGERWF